MYKESYYNFIQTFEDGNAIMYNSKSGSIVYLKKETVDEIMSILESPDENIQNDYFLNLEKFSGDI